MHVEKRRWLVEGTRNEQAKPLLFNPCCRARYLVGAFFVGDMHPAPAYAFSDILFCCIRHMASPGLSTIDTAENLIMYMDIYLFSRTAVELSLNDSTAFRTISSSPLLFCVNRSRF